MTDYSGKVKINSTDLIDIIKQTQVNSAIKATQDSNGSVISSTYVKTINSVGPDSSGNITLQTSSSFPSGTQLLFYQSAAPTGWTKVAGIGNRAVKIVEDTTGGTTGGTNNFSNTFKSLSTNSVSTDGTVGGTSLSVAQLASHNHDARTSLYHGGSIDIFGGATMPNKGDKYLSIGSTGSNGTHAHSFTGSSHSHTVDLRVKYINVIVCKKD